MLLACSACRGQSSKQRSTKVLNLEYTVPFTMRLPPYLLSLKDRVADAAHVHTDLVGCGRFPAGARRD